MKNITFIGRKITFKLQRENAKYSPLSPLRKAFHRIVPAHFQDPFGLLIRLLRSRNPAATFTLLTSILAFFATPLDLILSIAERHLYRTAKFPRMPIIFVTGAPRSGTSLAAQVLISHLPIVYFNNLTAIFQRSPIIANTIFGRLLRRKNLTFQSHYGKTATFSGANDGLHIWDRWVGKDRTRIPTSIDKSIEKDMIRFFGAYEKAFQRALLNKNNNLCSYANLVANIFDNSYFLCMTRDSSYLAQSLLKARTEIHGDLSVPYGIHNPNRPLESGNPADYVEDVCEQVIFHQEIIRKQQQLIGSNRFWIISYEDLCKNPEVLVKNVAENILNYPIDVQELQTTLKPFKNSNNIKVEKEIFQKIESTLQVLIQDTRIDLIQM
jgi:hypothetical protein